MSDNNKISADFTSAEKDAILLRIKDVQNALPFLISLPEGSRLKNKTMGPKSVAYVKQCLEGAKAFPNELKASFKTTEFEKDVQLVDNLLGVKIALMAFLELVDDSLTAGGIDAMTQSSEVYKQLKISAKNDANVKSMVDLIGERYAALKKPRKKKTE